MANLHILSPPYCEGTEVSRCMVGSIKICISRNSDNPTGLFFFFLCGVYCTLMNSKRLQGN